MQPFLAPYIRHAFRQVPFQDLAVPHQLAAATFMAVDGQAWELPGGADQSLEAQLPGLIQRYGHHPFWVGLIPTLLLQHAFMMSPDIESAFVTWDDYHRWYATTQGIPDHSADDAWPVILDPLGPEPLLDGNHRFHRYVQLGEMVIPALIPV